MQRNKRTLTKLILPFDCNVDKPAKSASNYDYSTAPPVRQRMTDRMYSGCPSDSICVEMSCMYIILVETYLAVLNPMQICQLCVIMYIAIRRHSDQCKMRHTCYTDIITLYKNTLNLTPQRQRAQQKVRRLAHPDKANAYYYYQFGVRFASATN